MEEITLVSYAQTAADSAKGLMVSDAIAKTGGAFNADTLAKMGFSFDTKKVAQMMAMDAEYAETVKAMAKDAGFELGDANIDALGQFFMVWNEQIINRLYRGRTAIQTFGVKTMGDWLTEKIIFRLRELTGANTGIYGDHTRPGYVSYNYGYDTRDTVRFEWGLEVTKYEEAVGSVMRRNVYKDKKDAIVLKQEIWENTCFWKGLTLNAKKIYGVLNEVNLPLAQTMGVDFASATVKPAEVVACLRQMKQKLASDLQGNGDIETLPVELCFPIKWQTAFTAIDQGSLIGYSANKWLAENWKYAHLSFKPELDDADSGEPMALVFATGVPGVGMDTINLARTSALRLVGAMPTLKGREEAYSSSIAGALVACPMGVQLWTAP